jgi:hypothetical protein
MIEQSGATRGAVRALIQAGLLTALIDGLFAAVSSVVYGSTPARVFQGVAATLIGPQSFQGGTRTAAIGVAMHVGVAFAWSAVFLALVLRSSSLRRAIRSARGQVTTAAVYGPLVWVVMSLVVIPLLLQPPASLTMRWWIQLLGHFPFVGLPIVMSIARTLSRRNGKGRSSP